MTSSFNPDAWFPLVSPATETTGQKRAALHSPEPIGLGTGGVESLRSFLLRIADAHCIFPGALAQFLDQRHSTRRSGRRLKETLFRESRICGAGELAKSWASAAELATGRKNLEQLTFFPLRHVLPFASTMSPRRKWCPICVSEHSGYTEVHEPLLWCLQAVDACPRHGTLLVRDCGCGAKTSRFSTGRKLHPGVCPRCSRAFTSEKDRIFMPAPAKAVREARLATDLILLGQQGRIGPAARKTFVDFLCSAAEQLDGGGRKAFARRLGCSPGQLKGWMSGHHKLTLQNALHVISTLGANVEGAFVSGVYVPNLGAAAVGGGLRKKQVRRPANPDWSKRLAGLVEAQNMEPPPSLASVGRKLGVSARTLRKKWPEHCRTIAKRYADWKQSAYREAVEERVARLREVAEQLALQGIRPTRRRIMEVARITDWKYFKKRASTPTAEAMAVSSARRSVDAASSR